MRLEIEAGRDGDRVFGGQLSRLDDRLGRRTTATAIRRWRRQSSGRTTTRARQPGARSKARLSSAHRATAWRWASVRFASAAARAAARSPSCARRFGPIAGKLPGAPRHPQDGTRAVEFARFIWTATGGAYVPNHRGSSNFDVFRGTRIRAKRLRSSGCQQRREAARGCGKDCICEEVQDGFMRAKSS